MKVVLSRRNDAPSLYEDDMFSVYHYPAKYRNHLKPNDVFVYYHGHKSDKEQRYYFGTGSIGSIRFDNEDYCANLMCFRKFASTVPIVLPEGGYVEQLDYEEVRQSCNPPWQSAIRPISQLAYDYIINHAGLLTVPEFNQSIEQLSENIKKATRGYFLQHTNLSLLDIERNAHRLADLLCASVTEPPVNVSEPEPQDLVTYCEGMRISYSYKPLLILALLEYGDSDGSISLERAASYFLHYYHTRRLMGRLAEIKPCIYLNTNVDVEASITNLQTNPVKALMGSGFFEFDKKTKVFSIHAQLWNKLTASDTVRIRKACIEKLNRYYGEN